MEKDEAAFGMTEPGMAKCLAMGHRAIDRNGFLGRPFVVVSLA